MTPTPAKAGPTPLTSLILSLSKDDDPQLPPVHNSSNDLVILRK